MPTVSRLGCPIARPSKLVSIGFNYADHARATGEPLPAELTLPLKATTALAGSTDPILRPPSPEQADWEAELGVVIGRTARFASEMVE